MYKTDDFITAVHNDKWCHLPALSHVEQWDACKVVAADHYFHFIHFSWWMSFFFLFFLFMKENDEKKDLQGLS